MNNENFSEYYTLKKGLLIILSGPSGSGKSLVCQEYIKNHPETVLSVSETTREPREGEVEGVNYYFISQEEYEKRVKSDYYLETAGKYKNYYGTPKKRILDDLNEGKDVILEIEMKGAAQVREKIPGAISIFILPNSMEVLEKQIRGRNTESEEAIQLRLSETRSEVDEIKNYNYVIINKFGYLDQTVKVLEDIIVSEHHSIKRILDQYKNE